MVTVVVVVLMVWWWWGGVGCGGEGIIIFIISSSSSSLLGIISVSFDITDQLLIRSFSFVKYWRRNGSTMRQYISCS
jgi:hypothetical protein